MAHRIRLGFAFVITGSLTATRPAGAYNYDTHNKMVDTAVYVAQHADNYIPIGPLPADWAQYLNDVKAIGTKLGGLQTGIADQEGDRDDAPDANPAPWVGDPTLCGYDPHDKMNTLGQIRLQDSQYVPNRTKSAAGCGAHRQDSTIYNNAFASTLGWLAGSVDDHLHDVVLWYRPTNALGVGALKKVADEVGRAVVGTLLIPLVCVYEWLFGSGCDPHDAYDLASQNNPLHIIDTIVPGFGSHVSSDYTGIWHFEDVAASSGENNQVRGLLYERAGRTRPGVVDVVIMSLSDALGLSLNNDSDGISKYAHYDETQRNSSDWEVYSLGHVEFSPLHNLARYGWDQFVVYQPTSAAGLAWPLHALGDASEPHHVWGTTSWGHRPFEDWVSQHWEGLTDSNDISQSVDVTVGQQVLQQGYIWWSLISQTHDVAGLVTELARTTNALGVFAMNDTASLAFHTGSEDIAVNMFDSEENIFPNTQVLLENGMGAMVAFLTEAAKNAQVAATIVSTCPTSMPFWDGTECSTNSPNPPSPPVSSTGVCGTGTTCSGVTGSAGAAGGGGSGGSGGSGGGSNCVPDGNQCTATTECCDAAALCFGGFCLVQPR